MPLALAVYLLLRKGGGEKDFYYEAQAGFEPTV